MRGVKRLKKLYRRFTKESQIIAHKYPYRVQCNICGWKGRCLFSDSWHPYTICPRCRSQVRHRLLFAAITTLPNLGVKDLIQGKRILHFAPEPIISQLLVDKASTYVSADLCRDYVDIRLDMCNMSSVADSSFDLVIACDVLEHVPDDSSALREIHRVLTTHGWAILTVPQMDNRATKFEDHTVTTPEGRKKAFGQEDHLRIYGDDFGLFLENHHFTVTTVNKSDFDSKMVKKYVLFPPILSNHPLATNHRKVYFGQKGSV